MTSADSKTLPEVIASRLTLGFAEFCLPLVGCGHLFVHSRSGHFGVYLHLAVTDAGPTETLASKSWPFGQYSLSFSPQSATSVL